MVWRLSGPPRPKACLWLFGKGKILTKDALVRRGMVVPVTCQLCNLEPESIAHNCTWSAVIWENISSYLGRQIVTEFSVPNFIIQWISNALQGRAKVIWHHTILAAASSIWRARNKAVFDQVLSDPGQVADGIRRLVATWATGSKMFSGYIAIDIWRDGAPFFLGRQASWVWPRGDVSCLAHVGIFVHRCPGSYSKPTKSTCDISKFFLLLSSTAGRRALGFSRVQRFETHKGSRNEKHRAESESIRKNSREAPSHKSHCSDALNLSETSDLSIRSSHLLHVIPGFSITVNLKGATGDSKLELVRVSPILELQPIKKVRLLKNGGQQSSVSIIQGNDFWESGKELIAVVEPLVKVLRLVDGDGSTMGYVYEAMDRAKESIKKFYKENFEKYDPFWDIIDKRWDRNLHSPLHATSAYFNPQFWYKGMIRYDSEIKRGIDTVIRKMVPQSDLRIVLDELKLYHSKDRNVFGLLAVEFLDKSHPAIKITTATPLPKLDLGNSMEEEISAFYVVQKGDIIGVYRTLKDCQFQVSDPSVSVYKGYSMRKETEEYLRSTGLKNAMYTINSKDVTCDLFGALESCNNRVHVSSSLERDVLVSSTSSILASERLPYESSVPIPLKLDGRISFSGIETSKQKRPEKASESDCKMQLDGLSSYFGKSSGETLKRNKVEEAIKLNFRMASCLLEFDGASKGNPGKGGAGAILRSEDGKVICRLSEGLGIVTNNFAEYKAVILGMKYALKKGYECIQVQGDSMLVCMQIQNKWQTKHANIMELSKEAKELKERFRSFEINHVRRELNTEADTLANMAVNLESGVVQEG